MIPMTMQTLALSGAQAVGFALLVGLPVVVGLIWAGWLGNRIRWREPPAPRSEEQPRLPDEGPVREEYEVREPDELEPDGRRLQPYEVKGRGATSRRGASQRRRRWSPGSSGAFGSGGSGSG